MLPSKAWLRELIASYRFCGRLTWESNILRVGTMEQVGVGDLATLRRFDAILSQNFSISLVDRLSVHRFAVDHTEDADIRETQSHRASFGELQTAGSGAKL
jgi:hypothetical protein